MFELAHRVPPSSASVVCAPVVLTLMALPQDVGEGICFSCYPRYFYAVAFLVDARYALYPPYISGSCLSVSGLSPADEILRHFLQVDHANHAGGLAQAQVSQQVVVARQRQVAFGGEQLLLRVEYVEVGAHAALDALLRGFDQQACGFDGFRLRADAQRSAQRLAVVFAQVD